MRRICCCCLHPVSLTLLANRSSSSSAIGCETGGAISGTVLAAAGSVSTSIADVDGTLVGPTAATELRAPASGCSAVEARPASELHATTTVMIASCVSRHDAAHATRQHTETRSCIHALTDCMQFLTVPGPQSSAEPPGRPCWQNLVGVAPARNSKAAAGACTKHSCYMKVRAAAAFCFSQERAWPLGCGYKVMHRL